MVQTADNCGFSAVAVHQSRCLSGRDTVAHPHGPCDHRDCQLLLDTVVNAPVMHFVQVHIPVVAPRLVHMVLTVQQTIATPQQPWTR